MPTFLKEILCISTDAMTTLKGREEIQQDLKWRGAVKCWLVFASLEAVFSDTDPKENKGGQ